MSEANRLVLFDVEGVVGIVVTLEKLGEAEVFGQAIHTPLATVHTYARQALSHDIFASRTDQSTHRALPLLVEGDVLTGTQIKKAVMNLPAHGQGGGPCRPLDCCPLFHRKLATLLARVTFKIVIARLQQNHLVGVVFHLECNKATALVSI